MSLCDIYPSLFFMHWPNIIGPPPILDETTLLAMQQQMAQQAAFSQIPDVVKRVSYYVDV